MEIEKRRLVLKSVGYFCIWADFYLVLFAFHALFISPISFGSYLQEYFQVARFLLDWVASWNWISMGIMEFWFGFPAVAIFTLRFSVSTALGVWLVKRFG